MFVGNRDVFKRLSNNQYKSNYSNISITTGVNSAMNLSDFLGITYNLLKARENRAHKVVIGFDFAFFSLVEKLGRDFWANS